MDGKEESLGKKTNAVEQNKCHYLISENFPEIKKKKGIKAYIGYVYLHLKLNIEKAHHVLENSNLER